MSDKLEIANLATDEKRRLIGFKVVGVFPYYLKYITVRTHIKLSGILDSISKGVEEPKVSDFDDPELQKRVSPLIEEYIVTALVNDRFAGWFFRIFLKLKLKRCGHYHILNLYMTIKKLDNPAFFLTYWNAMMMRDDTLLRAEEPS